MSLPKSLLMLSEISESIQSLDQEIDRCMQVLSHLLIAVTVFIDTIDSFQVSASADIKRAQMAQSAAAARDSAEMLSVLQSFCQVVTQHMAGTQPLSPVSRDVVQNIKEVCFDPLVPGAHSDTEDLGGDRLGVWVERF